MTDSPKIYKFKNTCWIHFPMLVLCLGDQRTKYNQMENKMTKSNFSLILGVFCLVSAGGVNSAQPTNCKHDSDCRPPQYCDKTDHTCKSSQKPEDDQGSGAAFIIPVGKTYQGGTNSKCTSGAQACEVVTKNSGLMGGTTFLCVNESDQCPVG